MSTFLFRYVRAGWILKWLTPFCVLAVSYAVIPLPATFGIPGSQARQTGEIRENEQAPPRSETNSQEESRLFSITEKTSRLQSSWSETLRFEHFSLEDGLASDLVYCVWQDHFGFLWIGTADGLNRYDGYEFKVYRNDPFNENSLSSNIIYTIFEDSRGELWIGTNGAGLNRFDRQNERFIRYQNEPGNANSLSNDIVYWIHEDNRGELWIATWGGGLNRFDRQSERFIHYQNDPEDPNSLTDNHVPSIYEDRSGNLWFPTAYGLNRFDPQTEHFIHYELEPANPFSLGAFSVTSIAEDQEGQLWVGTQRGGLRRLDKNTGKFTAYIYDPDDPFSLNSNQVFSLLVDRQGLLWIGTLGGGINLFDRAHNRFIRYQHQAEDPFSISSDYIYMLYEDHDGTIWVATNNGLSRYDRQREKFRRHPILSAQADNLGQERILSMFEDSASNLWIGTDFGLQKIDPLRGEVERYEQIPENPNSLVSGPVTAIYEDREGSLWIGSGSSGIDRFDRNSNIFTHYQRSQNNPLLSREDSINSIYEDRDGDLWFGTASGLTRYNHQNHNFTHFYISPNSTDQLTKDNINSILEDQEGLLWIATSRHGLLQFDRKNEIFIHTPANPDGTNQIVSDGINTLFEDSRGRIWIGSAVNGLVSMDGKNQTFIAFNTDNGLAGKAIYWIQEDRQGYLWVVTDHGLAKFDPEAGSFENYDVSDSLYQNEFDKVGCYRKNGEMLLGGMGGILAFYPDQITINPLKPPIALTSLKVGRDRLDLTKAPESLTQVNLSWPDTDFEFEFTALNFTHPQRNQYAYKLEGYDTEWNYTETRRFGRYTNLSGGNYTLHIIGTNNEEVWNEAGTAINIKVTPPFWQTLRFQGGITVLLIFGIVSGYWLRVADMNARRRKLEQQVAGRTKELSALNSIAATVSQSLDLHETLQKALKKTLEVMENDTGGIYLLDDKNEILTIAAQQGFSPELLEKINALQVGEGFSGQVVQSGKPVMVKDMAEDSRLTRTAVVEAGLHSIASVPLTSKGKVLGALFVVTRGQREFNVQEIELLTSIGQQIGMAVENNQLYEETRHKLAQLAALQETNRAMVSTLELDALLNLIVQQATNLMQANGGILNLVDWEAGEDEVVACIGTAAEFIGLRSHLENSLSGWVTLHKQPVFSNQLKDDPRVIQHFDENFLGKRPKNAAAVPLNIKGRVLGTLVIVNKSGGKGEFTQSDLDLLVSFANQAASAIENARLYAGEKRRAEQFRLINEVGQQITSEIEVNVLLDQMARLIQEALSYYYVGIGMIEGDEVVLKAEAGVGADIDGFLRFKLGQGCWGWVAQFAEPILIPDASKDPRCVYIPGATEVRSQVCVPLKTKDEVIGILSAESDRLRAFDESDLLVLQSLAHQAAIAVENIRFYARAQQIAVMEERSRLARELHDAVTQTIFSASLLAEALPEIWENDPIEGRQVMKDLRGLSRGALAEMRTLLLELRPAALSETHLEDLLRQLGEGASGREGIPVVVAIEGQAELPPDVHLAFYRIAQEALNNVVKHARASEVTVRLCYSSNDKDGHEQAPNLSVLLVIMDNGCGFDWNLVLPDHLGLEIMRERAEKIGAALIVESQPGEGTQVTVLWEQNNGLEAKWGKLERSGC